jgi:UDP-3-O-[3-hydroxymyristoyl] glucosamine N-acyltransferase
VPHRLSELAARVGGSVLGDGEFMVVDLATLEGAGGDHLAFLTDTRHRAQAESSAAGALLVGRRVPAPEAFGRPLLLVDDPGLALNTLLEVFHPAAPPPPVGIHLAAVVDRDARVDPAASVGPFAVVGAGSVVGPGSVLHPHVVVGRDCTLGNSVVLHPHVVLYDRTELGDRVVVHAGVVLGSDGFGYLTRGGAHLKVPQVGRVVIGADVEIGANSTVDRALLTETRIGAGTKVDNLVQVGHNVEVGRGCLLCGQAGIAGSAQLGDGVVLAGQAGVAGHLRIGDGAAVAAKSAALQAVPARTQVAGIPAIELRAWRRQAALLGRLGELFRRLRAAERALGLDARGARADEGAAGD